MVTVSGDDVHQSSLQLADSSPLSRVISLPGGTVAHILAGWELNTPSPHLVLLCPFKSVAIYPLHLPRK